MKFTKITLTASILISMSAFAADKAQRQTIKFPQIGPYPVNLAPFPLKAIASSGLELVYETLTPKNCVVENRAVWLLEPGVCIIKASQMGSEKFNPATSEKSFLITAIK